MAGRSSFLFFGIKIVSGAVMFVCTVYILLALGPSIERTTAPVISKYIITSLEAVDGGAKITAVIEKYRDCEYIGIRWYKIGNNGVDERLPVTTIRPVGDASNPTRAVGRQPINPIIVSGVTTTELWLHSYAEIEHRCHVLWSITTRMFP